MNQIVPIRTNGAEIMENVLIKGDLSKLSAEERSNYYMKVCESVGLNPLTKPFEYITLNGKLTLYALRTCTDQLRGLHKVSVVELSETEREGIIIVTAKVENGEGRSDMAKGAVTIGNLKGDALCNAIMKAETKAKRRATLSLCGLGFLDETEIETVPPEAKAPKRHETLPKASARTTYAKLQTELSNQPTATELEKWGVDAAERIKLMPEDWQDILRLQYQERMLEFKQGVEKDEPPRSNEGLVKWIDGVLSGVKDPGLLEPTWNMKVEPYMIDLPEDTVEAISGLYRRHEARLAP